MNYRLAALLLLSIAVAAPAVHSAEQILEFASPQEKQRYHALVDELRCMVCQNQNLADSNAELAKDLRERVYGMIRTGRSDVEIIDYMVERYGTFVLYRPPFRTTTMLLWLGPVIFLSIAGVTFWLYSRRQRQNPASELSAEQREQAQRLLNQ